VVWEVNQLPSIDVELAFAARVQQKSEKGADPSPPPSVTSWLRAGEEGPPPHEASLQDAKIPRNPDPALRAGL
jgi:hypothetical protein